MKFVMFNEGRLGLLENDQVKDITEIVAQGSEVARENLPLALIGSFDKLRERILGDRGSFLSLAEVKLGPPVPRPGNILCMAVNYNDGLITSPHVNAFHKAANAIIGPGQSMVLPNIPATAFEGEAELAVVIGRQAKNVLPKDAMEYVFGYMNFIDGSARGVQPATNSFFQMKSRDTFAPIGPYLVTKNEIADPQNLDIRAWVNGQLKQDFNTRTMTTTIAESIAWLSEIQTLMPGDIVATGTDHCGLNAFQDGDLVEMEALGLGRLHILVKDDLKRTWSRETRIDRKNQGFAGAETIAPQLSGKYSKADQL
ncbi:fumarylacetoacetate hydrolase family protein [Bradyrhizobium sp. Gha]|uniref:fumarylacetoacetate hydrolase family protein n=1 Tax=Bradyrhizobium sp. Gha TaxID=1855318 RepID=UPI0008E64AEE|nr:fumarylacetoacetate hydrolase family protein [Bradyrhizobium sp. Gha]SFI94844.1 2-keto-4-pentenoate hydratase/2-oxohepta-3-ene-1,7-dioic acid hydratase (catechol pathway) [Bradyrhizobium sp. Gha]